MRLEIEETLTAQKEEAVKKINAHFRALYLARIDELVVQAILGDNTALREKEMQKQTIIGMVQAALLPYEIETALANLNSIS